MVVNHGPCTRVDVKKATASLAHGLPFTGSKQVSKESGSLHNDGALRCPRAAT
jgi:hypothetical protein